MSGTLKESMYKCRWALSGLASIASKGRDDAGMMVWKRAQEASEIMDRCLLDYIKMTEGAQGNEHDG